MSRRLILIFASLIAVSPGKAQLTQSDSARLRAEIASTLLEFEWGYTRPLAFRFGEAGGNLPAEMIPSGFEILGGTGSGTLLAKSALEPIEAERTIREHLLARGITAFEPRRFGREEGFVFGQPPSASDWKVRQYCLGANLIRVSVRQQWPDKPPGSVVYLRYSSNYAPCSAEASPQPLDFDQPSLEMPILRPPPGASSNGSGMGGGGDSDGGYRRTARAEVRSEMTPGEIVLFYTAQLTEQGWTVGQPAIVADGAIVSARKTDKEGRDLNGVLADIKAPRGMHYLTFQIDRVAPPRSRGP